MRPRALQENRIPVGKHACGFREKLMTEKVTDFHGHPLRFSYVQAVLAEEISEDDKERILRGNARRFLEERPKFSIPQYSYNI